MSYPEDQYHTPLLDKFHAPRLLRPTPRLLHPTSSRIWITLLAMATQGVLCGLVWAFAGVMLGNKIIPLPDNLAGWTRKNPSDTNMLITVISTMLGMIGSCLLGIAVQHALTFRLSRGIHLYMVTAWIQLARNSLFLRPRRHLGWTLISVIWVVVVGLLTTAWSNLLTPEILVQRFPVAGWDLDFLNPALSNLVLDHLPMPYIPPTARNSPLTPGSLGFLGNNTGYLSQAGKTAAMVSINPEYPAFIGQFNSSTGGVNPAEPSYQLSVFPVLQENYQGLSTSYTLVQQGYTANISCRLSSSPAINLNNSASAEHTFKTPLDPQAFGYTLETWSWSTNCSGNGEYYTGEVDILTSNASIIGNGLFATSVCFYQDFFGPSNESFLVLMQSPNNSGYNGPYFTANPNLPIVCQFTPMVTTVQVQYNQSATANVNNVLDRVLLPEDSWPLASIQGSVIWAAYLYAQGAYSNSFADDPLEAASLLNYQLPNGDITPLLEQYLRGIFEYMGSGIRAIITEHLSPEGPLLPNNMTIPISGTMDVQTVGWRSHPRTHGIALSVITIVTIVTAAFGIYALLEATYQETARNLLGRGGTWAFDPTCLMDVLVASSMGSLGNALSHPRGDEYREGLMVEVAVTNMGQSMLNARMDVPDNFVEVNVP